MARFSHGSRRAIPWAVAQKPRPLPRVVRLGRAANDNARGPGLLPARLLAISLIAMVAAAALAEWIL
jgi:hypothetical protein